MAVAKDIEFSPAFEQKIADLTGTKGVRGETLKNIPLGEIFENAKNIKENSLKPLKILGFENLTITEIYGAKKREFAETIINSNKLTPTQKGDLLKPFKGLLAEVGITAQGSTNPIRSELVNVVGKSAYSKAGLGTASTRLIPASYGIEAYQTAKKVAAEFNAAGQQEPKTLMLLQMFGGYRPSDFKNIKLENINFETGLVSGVSLKTDTDKTIKLAYLPQAQLDIIKSFVKDRKEGLLFPNLNSATDLINEKLSKTNLSIEYYQESTSSMVNKPFSSYDFRRIKETDLTAAGINQDSIVRKLFSWRAASDIVAKYTAGAGVASQLEEANSKAFTPYVALTDGNVVSSGTKSHGQFLLEVGVQPGEFTKTYMATKQMVKNIPPNLQIKMKNQFGNIPYTNSIDGSAINDNILEPNIESANKYQQLANTELEVKQNQASIQLAKELPAANEAKEIIAENKKNTLLQKKADSKAESANKGKSILSNWISKVGKPLKTLTGGAIGLELFNQAINQPAAFARDVAIDAVTRTNPYLIAGDMVVRSVSEAGAGSDVVRKSEISQSGQSIPSRQMGMESESQDSIDQNDFLQNMQNVVQKDADVNTDKQSDQVANILQEDADVGSKMSTFGRQPDVKTGFAIRPNRSELGDETERQLNQNSFLGVT